MAWKRKPSSDRHRISPPSDSFPPFPWKRCPTGYHRHISASPSYARYLSWQPIAPISFMTIWQMDSSWASTTAAGRRRYCVQSNAVSVHYLRRASQRGFCVITGTGPPGSGRQNAPVYGQKSIMTEKSSPAKCYQRSFQIPTGVRLFHLYSADRGTGSPAPSVFFLLIERYPKGIYFDLHAHAADLWMGSVPFLTAAAG